METPNDKVPILNEAEKQERVRTLNDLLRLTFTGGRVLKTQGVSALPEKTQMEILQRVQNFNAFTPDNDPYGEHDFGSIDNDGLKIFWKIDIYDQSLEFAAEEPWNRDKSIRVLTIMLAEEY